MALSVSCVFCLSIFIKLLDLETQFNRQYSPKGEISRVTYIMSTLRLSRIDYEILIFS